MESVMTATSTFAPAIAEVLVPDLLPPLGPGTPNEGFHAKLKNLQIDTAFAPQAVRDRDMAACCLAGLWLLHGYLDESHKISQEIETTSGSYWHGLMHRREPDYGNSKYWFRRVGPHTVFDVLCKDAKALVGPDAPSVSRFLATQTTWDPAVFIDLCATAVKGPEPLVKLCRQVQHSEWRLLFDYCYRKAIGAG